MKNSFVKGFLAFLTIMLSFTAAIAVVLQVFKKFFKISIEFTPNYENDECECEECCEAVESEDDGIEFNLCDEEVEDCAAEAENA